MVVMAEGRSTVLCNVSSLAKKTSADTGDLRIRHAKNFNIQGIIHRTTIPGVGYRTQLAAVPDPLVTGVTGIGL
jgi:hypothetical protein